MSDNQQAHQSKVSVSLPNELSVLGEANFEGFRSQLTRVTSAFSEEKKAAIELCLQQHSKHIIAAFSLSDFISRIATQYPVEFLECVGELCRQPEHQFSHYQQAFSDLLATTDTELELHASIRRFRHLCMLEIAWRDMLYQADIKESLLAVSELADVLITQTNDWLYAKACQRYGAPEPYISVNGNGEVSPPEAQKLLILGMGKLGGRELNFSSDIDLIFVYPQAGETQHPRKPIEHSQFFTKLAQKLIAALHQTTIDGQAYRVDMRLRPLGDSGPLVVSMGAFEAYYLEQGREWERFAMQKARVLNADSAAVCELQNIIRPFVYRKYLDFTTVESLRAMKQLISNELARRNLQNNIKLGRGGIREVEFYIQSLQMIHAGKVTECQTRSILSSFEMLQKHEFLHPEIAEDLRSSYLFLRQVEHYLQAFNDEQTQTLPDDKTKQSRLCALLSEESVDAYMQSILHHTNRIHQHFSALIEDSNEAGAPGEGDISAVTSSENGQGFEDLWQLDLDKEEIFVILHSALECADGSEHAMATEKLSELLLDFKHKSTKHRIGQRGHNTLNKLIPLVLQELIEFTEHAAEQKTAKGLEALSKAIFGILLTILGRTAYLDLLLENPAVRQRLYTLSATSTWVAEQIKRFPLLLDELLHPAYLQTDDDDIRQWREDYQSELRLQMLRIEPEDIEGQMDSLRYFKLTQQLRIAAADISGTLPINKVSDKLSVLAEVILHHVIDLAWHQVCEKYGVLEGTSAQNKGLGVIAYGKLGGLELGYGSDLDIVFIHDIDLSLSTNGKKSISCSEFFVKLVQRVSHIFTVKTYLDELYEIDLRLRPSGNSGLLISHVDTYQQYQEKEAWTWEHQALVRARYIYGNKELGNKFTKLRHQVLARPREQEALRKEVADMREKMRTHLDKTNDYKIDLKQTSGGIADLEFLTQFWVLANTRTVPILSKWTDNLRILDELAAHQVIDEELAQGLQKAYLYIRSQVHRHNLTNKDIVHSEEMSALMALVKRTFEKTFSC